MPVMQIEVEFIPAVIGFSVGTLLLCLQRFGPGRGGPGGSGKGVGGGPKLEESLNHSLFEDEPPSPAQPVAEPGPEPECEAVVHAASKPHGGLTRHPAWAMFVPALTLVAAAVLFTVAWLAVPRTAATANAKPPPTMPEAAPLALTTTPMAEASVRASPVAPAVADAVPVAAVEAAVKAAPAAEAAVATEVALPVAAAAAAPVEAAAAAVEATVVETAAKAPQATEPQLSAEAVAETAAAKLPEASLDGDDFGEETSGDKVITMNLTRQHMATRTVNDVVFYKSAYWGTFNVGTPSVPFKVVFDTGSGHIILPSTYCRAPTCREHTRYKRSMSISALDIDWDGTPVQAGAARDQIKINFGTGEVTGVFVEDVVCVTGNDAALSMEGCKPMRIILATHMSEEPFRTFKFDGILGLGLSGLSQSPEFNFLDVMAGLVDGMGGVRPNMFSVFLASHSYESSDLTLGGYAKERMEGNLVWNNVWQPQLGHWLLQIKSIRIDDEAIGFCRDGCRAVVDTGTSLLSVPSASFPELYELLRHEAHPELGCKGQGPKFHIELEHITLTLEPSDYARPENMLGLQSSKMRPFLPPDFGRNETFRTKEYCKPMVMTMDLPAPVGPKLYVLGEPVMRKYYAVFDTTAAQPRIGFANAIHAPIPEDAEEDWDSDDFEFMR